MAGGLTSLGPRRAADAEAGGRRRLGSSRSTEGLGKDTVRARFGRQSVTGVASHRPPCKRSICPRPAPHGECPNDHVLIRTLQEVAASGFPRSASSCYIRRHRWRRVPPGFKGESMHKRALGAVAVTGVAALALSACGGSSPTTPSNTAAGTSNAATTTGEPETPSGTAAPVRDTNVDLVIWTDADRSKAVQKYADEFAARERRHRQGPDLDRHPRPVQGRHQGRQGSGRHRRRPRLAR